MSKLFKLKEWLTIDEAATHLANTLGEPVQPKDIYRLALDKHLTLSVNLVNHGTVKLGKLVTSDEVEFFELADDFKDFLKGIAKENGRGNDYEPDKVATATSIGGGLYLDFEQEVQSIQGVWDLPMIGSEALDVEHEYQQLTSGVSVELLTIEGAILRKDDVYAQVLMSFDDNEFQKGSEARRRRIESTISISNLSGEEAEELRSKHKTDREKYLENRVEKPRENDYHPRDGLPDGAVFVVRTQAILDFLNNLGEPTEEKLISTKERQSLLTIFAALCHEANIDYTERGIAKKITLTAEQLGLQLNEDTTRKYLKQIDDAIEARSK